MTGGVYAAELLLPVARRIQVGRLGRFTFPAGRYVYVGSAQRNLEARLARHARRRKVLRWHVDYLSRWAGLEAAWAWPRPKADECLLAAAVGALPGAAAGPAGFGASDCRCPTHLYRLDAAWAPRVLAASDPRWTNAVVYDAVRLRRDGGNTENG
jgi:sugar fermentation stimulation protein A